MQKMILVGAAVRAHTAPQDTFGGFRRPVRQKKTDIEPRLGKCSAWSHAACAIVLLRSSGA